mgnify:CR=1 FL=1
MEFDYIVVGAGAAGSVVARRLVDAGDTVLVLEAGPTDWHPLIQIPAGFFHLLRDGRASWGYSTQPVASIGGRSQVYPRGKVMGGSGAINGLMQSWGLPYDFDRWAASGCTGWSFEDVRPYFMKSEAYANGNPANRGHSGPITVSDFVTPHPLAEDLLSAGVELGLPVLKDYNSEFGEGVSLVQQTRKGRLRVTSASAYLRPVRSAANLKLETHAHVASINIEAGRVAGVSYLKGGVLKTANARREVILCAGAINTPHLLNISGIGDGAELQSLGIQLQHHLPQVGRNLQDHYVTKVVRRVAGKTTLNEQAKGAKLVKEVMKYLLQGKGILTYSFASATGYVKSAPELDTPDLQLSFAPGSFPPTGGYSLDPEPGVTLGIWQMRPTSRGEVRTVSADPNVAPAIAPGYLQTSADQRAAIEAVRWSRRFLFSKAFESYGGAEVTPGESVTSDEAILEYSRRTGSTTFHPVGSCRMGSDTDAVVDPQLRVRGLAGLRIADASVMPNITSSNTHAPTVMIAEKAADMIIQAARKS